MRAALTTLALVAAQLALAPAAEARTLFESDDGEYRLTLRTSLKGTWLLSYPEDDAMLPEVGGGAAFFRLRSELATRLTEYLSMQIAYEHRALASSSLGLGGSVLPSAFSPPFRLAALDWVIVDSGGYVHRHQFDRFFVALHLPFLELTVGRQAIGLGRGVLFSAIDVFSPFTPNEVDREWRGGVDAIHAELRIPDLEVLSADLFAVFGNVERGSLESWSLLGRIRAMVGDVDGEIVLGTRGEDRMVGGALSATVGDAEIHGELALFGTDGAGIDGGFFGTRGVVAKGVAGGSYNIDVLRGVRVVLEYHYSGFGVTNVGMSPSILFDDAYRSRALRGHSQTLGQHTLALALSTEVSDEVSIALSWFQSPVDGSGLVAPGLTWIPSDMLTLVFSGLVPWGTTPNGGVPRSEWGSVPFTMLVQARLYD